MLITNISLNFTIRTSWTWRGLKTIHLPFLRESVRCTVCSSPNVTYLKDCRNILGVWIDIANNIKFNKQVSTSVKLMKVWCNIILDIQEREKRPHKKYQLEMRDCGCSKIAWSRYHHTIGLLSNWFPWELWGQTRGGRSVDKFPVFLNSWTDFFFYRLCPQKNAFSLRKFPFCAQQNQ